MTTILDLPKDLVEDLTIRASQEGRRLDETVAELLRAGLAASALGETNVQVDDSMLAERERIAGKFLSGEWGVELSGFEEGRAADRDSAEVRDEAWRR